MDSLASDRRGLRAVSRRAFRLETVAPRLALAHRGRRAELAAARKARLEAADAVLEWERMVAHRELQVVRSEARKASRRDARYMRWRYAKLAAGRRELDAARARARALGL
jgi:hypothetical protein